PRPAPGPSNNTSRIANLPFLQRASGREGYRNMGVHRKHGVSILPKECVRTKLCLTNVVSHAIVKILLSAYSLLMIPAAFAILMAKYLGGPSEEVLHAGTGIPVAIC